MPEELLEGEIVETIYECWVTGQEGSFIKLSEDEAVGWATDQIRQLKPHQHVHIVPHLTSEYSDV